MVFPLISGSVRALGIHNQMERRKYERVLRCTTCVLSFFDIVFFILSNNYALRE